SGTISLPTGAATESTLSTLNGKVTACNTGAVVISSGTVTTVSTVTAVSDAQVQGKAAHDAAASGNPVLVGGFASNAPPSNVSADGDAARLWLNPKGAVMLAAYDGDSGTGLLTQEDGYLNVSVGNT